ncbi:hypothetical protein NIES39_K03020 [Arthrospira platensis NIES-39]|nr:hypothetical protein NIES39_K03020 [Arthrospira platensis NIES-39]
MIKLSASHQGGAFCLFKLHLAKKTTRFLTRRLRYRNRVIFKFFGFIVLT